MRPRRPDSRSNVYLISRTPSMAPQPARRCAPLAIPGASPSRREKPVGANGVIATERWLDTAPTATAVVGRSLPQIALFTRDTKVSYDPRNALVPISAVSTEQLCLDRQSCRAGKDCFIRIYRLCPKNAAVMAHLCGRWCPAASASSPWCFYSTSDWRTIDLSWNALHDRCAAGLVRRCLLFSG